MPRGMAATAVEIADHVTHRVLRHLHQHGRVGATRIVVPGGRVLLLDLREHDQSWVRQRLGDSGLVSAMTSSRRSWRAPG